MFLLATGQSQNFVQLEVKLNQHFRKGGICRVILKLSCVSLVSKKKIKYYCFSCVILMILKVHVSWGAFVLDLNLVYMRKLIYI